MFNVLQYLSAGIFPAPKATMTRCGNYMVFF